MNLEQTIKWFREQIDKLTKEHANLLQIKTYSKFYCYLDELERYRLCRSEFRREIELSGKKVMTKEYILNLIDEEVKDWKLDEITD